MIIFRTFKGLFSALPKLETYAMIAALSVLLLSMVRGQEPNLAEVAAIQSDIPVVAAASAVSFASAAER